MVKPRWWPAFTILALGALFVVHLWGFADTIRQSRVLGTIQTVVVVLLALLVWLLFASRLPGRVRLAGALGLVAVVGLAAALFRVRGVSGDVVPILEPRWARQETAPLPALPAEAAPPAPAAEAPASAVVPEAGRRPDVPEPALPAPSPVAPAALPRLVRDYPQFLGPGRDATLPDLHLARDWTARPPRRLWRQPIGAGWSSFAVAGRLAVTQEQRGSDELVVAYDLATGKPRWSHAEKARYETVIAGIGPRSTPTIVGGRVYAMGGTGILDALDIATGRRLWSHQVVEEAGAIVPDWGKSCSPLVVGRRVIVSAGGSQGRSLVAYDAETGRKSWSAGNDLSSYSSPVLATIAGQSQVLMLNQGSVTAHDPETGEILWEQPWPAEQPTVATPVAMAGDRLLLSAGYGVGAKLYEVTRREDRSFVPRLVWESPRLKSKFANLVVEGGFVFGLDDGVLTCLDPATGERRWKKGSYGHGQIILAGGVLLVQTEEGEIVLAEASPEGHRELTRFRVLDGKTWNAPALAGSVLLVRNDQEAAAYELPLAGAAASAGAQ
jgi:outer membrane protein assembly factor BamB